ncbi:hypothetical protein AGDE_03447 [Angomonas deanei]|uniref:Uncharacterized protein n=1 Tax=Angomonas deanei TaxID=59799 RepID=A0A7G2CLS8_9TRYP|nr:hypothetical protein AGDE_03447 [Angomonas deanei]CAD2219212.1 Protein of unknown function (DUF962), putative [Angomonas deanei]|eukprot:EPY40481.1 hypothetical protein AGDE_03447 [Angomonas deanei]
MPQITAKLEIKASNHKEYHVGYMFRHSKPWTRRMHLIGTVVAVGGVVAGGATQNPIAVGGAVAGGVALAAAGDLIVERQNPSFLKNPIYATMSHFKMCWQIVKGDIKL